MEFYNILIKQRTLLLIALSGITAISGCVAVIDSERPSKEAETVDNHTGLSIKVSTIRIKQSKMTPVIQNGIISTGFSNNTKAFIITDKTQLDSLNFEWITERSGSEAAESIRNTDLNNNTIIVVQARSSRSCNYSVKEALMQNHTARIIVDRECGGGNSRAVMVIETLIIKLAHGSDQPLSGALISLNEENIKLEAQTPLEES